MKNYVLAALMSTSSVYGLTSIADWQNNMQCGDLSTAMSSTQLKYTDYNSATSRAMNACADWCQTQAATSRNLPAKFCCDFLDNTRASDATTTVTDSRGTTTTTTKDYNECWLTTWTKMIDSRTHAAFKFKVEDTTTTDTTAIQAAKVFTFMSAETLSVTTDADGTDELTNIELELHADGTDNFNLLLNKEAKLTVKANQGKQFQANGFKFNPQNENCFLVLNVYEDDERSGKQKASTMIRCNEVDMAISKLQFRANTAGGEAMDEPSLAITYTISDVATF